MARVPGQTRSDAALRPVCGSFQFHGYLPTLHGALIPLVSGRHIPVDITQLHHRIPFLHLPSGFKA